MNFKKIYFLWLMVVFTTINSLHALSYERHPHVDEEVWNTLQPYFLPENSPEKNRLDRIFNRKAVLRSRKSLKKAGFIIVSPENKIIVAAHEKLEGFLIKAYLDTDPVNEWYWWKRRIDNASLIQSSIDDYGYAEIMKVPKKWIYPLPRIACTDESALAKHFILVVEDVSPLDPHRNHKAYRKQMTPAALTALYRLINEHLLIGSVYADNVPFCKNGQLAFLDTEHKGDDSSQLHLSSVARYLSDEMRAFWDGLRTCFR